MNYPEFLKVGDTIGITAISKGIYEDYKQKRLDNAIKYLEEKGFKVIETPNVRKWQNGRSSTGSERAKEFMELWKNENVKAIIMAAGGDYAIEMLDYLDLEELRKYKPKWVQGFSDVTTIGYLLPTCLEIPTIYADNVVSYGMRPIHVSLEKALEVMMGKTMKQYSYDKYQSDYLEYGLEDYFKPYQSDLLNSKIIENYDYDAKTNEAIFFKELLTEKQQEISNAYNAATNNVNYRDENGNEVKYS